MAAVGAILGWFFALVSNFVVWMTSAVVGHVVATQVAEAIMRVVRIGVVLALVITLVNLAIPDGVPISINALWDQYIADVSPFFDSLGYFLPLDLLFALMDLYVLGVTIVFVLWVVRRVVESSQ